MIEIYSLHSGYGKEDVLNGVSLKCIDGRITTLIGPNGCGKSTLLKSILGTLNIKKGDIKIDNVSLRDLNLNERARKIAYLSQGKNLPDISVRRMVLHGRFPYLSYPRKYRKCDFEAAEFAMKKMGIEELADKNMAELSGGMRQKVYIAMSLCQGANIIMLDEPNTYLDISYQIKISEICRDLANDGKTVITVSHDIISALKNSDYIAIMQNGKIVKYGTPQDVMESDIILSVFGVEVVSFVQDGQVEYFYRK